MYGGGYTEVMDYGAIDAFPNPGYGTTAGGRMISWCRKWPMYCKINSALNLRCRDQLIHRLSQNGITW
jgi:hypothetical protein